jgi:hypothetical protein
MGIDTIKKIEIEGKEYLIFLVNIDRLSPQFPAYINAYTYIEGIEKIDDEFLDYPTYKDTNIIGVDTAHSFNESMTLDEKREDAIRQITDCIKSYLKLNLEVKDETRNPKS